MKSILIAGIIIVNFAFTAYSIGIINQLRKKKINRLVLNFLSLGIIFDVTATICMVIGSSEGALTLHGIIGYSSLAGMLIDTILSYRFVQKNGIGASTPASFNKWSTIAYIYWVLAYITGAILVAVR
ncbi:MAG: hypothetical protein WCO63_12640 [Bacteroidota bacterium]